MLSYINIIFSQLCVNHNARGQVIDKNRIENILNKRYFIINFGKYPFGSLIESLNPSPILLFQLNKENLNISDMFHFFYLIRLMASEGQPCT